MFKIARIAKQVFNAARNIPKLWLPSTNSIFKYGTQSKGYIEDVRDEFTFESFNKILPRQSVTKDQFKASAAIFQGTSKLGSIGSYKILDSAEIRKLIYARFADKLKEFKSQGYDFAATREVLQNRNQDTSQSPKSIFERMKELSISGYLSNYAGDPQLREDMEKVILQKELVINEFMERVNERVGFISVDNESSTDVTMTDLLGEY